MNEDELVNKIVEALKEVMAPKADDPAPKPATESTVTDDVDLSEKLDYISQQIEEITLNEPNPRIKDDDSDGDDDPDDDSGDEEELSDEEMEKMANILKL